jgi:hypothetical protein
MLSLDKFGGIGYFTSRSWKNALTPRQPEIRSVAMAFALRASMLRFAPSSMKMMHRIL